MFFDARQMADEVPKEFDVCVVGAGIAGLVIARKLAESGLTVWLCESGGRKYDRRLQSLNAGRSNVVNYPFLSSRARAFGGTSTLWTGACVPLDPVDFERRAWIPHSGWPLQPKDLHTYLDAARADFGIGPTEAYAADLEKSPFLHADLQAKAVAYSTPLDLGERHGKMIATSKTIHCLLNATVTELKLCSDATRIQGLEIAAVGKPAIKVSPRMVVLACGGIENARLLLASNSIQSSGVGNAHGVVGRYHMEHPIRTVGILPVGTRYREWLRFTNRVRSGSGGALQGTFGLSAAAREREKLLDLHIRCYRYSRYEDQKPIIAGKRAINGIGQARHRSGLESFLRALRPITLRYLAWHTSNKVFRRARFDHLRLMAFLEQEPNSENRITLSNERDAFGQQLPFLTYHERSYMHDSARRTMAIMADAFRTAGFPGLRHGDDALAHLQEYNAYGLHQMGSTRMATDPRLGVVDKDCRVHGLSNLFVAGSSVFPTGGAANPTWTIAALSLRLADELRRQICYG